METVFWICFLIGVLYTIITVIFGDILAGAVDGALEWLQLDGHSLFQPMTIMSALTIFGGSGILLSSFLIESILLVVVASGILTVVGVTLLYFFYIKPMSNAENSIGFSIHDLEGKEAEVTIPIPAIGYGEVIIRTVSGISNHIAASFDKKDIPAASSVVVVRVQDGVLYVSKFEL